MKDRRPRSYQTFGGAALASGIVLSWFELEAADLLAFWALATIGLGFLFEAYAQSSYKDGFNDGFEVGMGKERLAADRERAKLPLSD